MSTKDHEAQIAQALGDALAGTGASVEEVTAQRAGKRRLLRVTVVRDISDLPADDHTSRVEPLTLDEIADATRVIGDTLDAGQLTADEPYVLEVSSFGLDQPLTEPAHFRRNVGRLLAVNTTDDEVVTGRVVSADQEGVTLVVQDGGDEAGIRYEDITRARVEIEFSRHDEEDDE